MAVFPMKQTHSQKKNDKCDTMQSPGAQLIARLGPNTPDILVSNTTILKDDDHVYGFGGWWRWEWVVGSAERCSVILWKLEEVEWN